jgi:hypothetical protein
MSELQGKESIQFLTSKSEEQRVEGPKAALWQLRQLGNSASATTRKLGICGISASAATRQLGNPTTRKLGNPATRQFGI